MLSYRKLAMRVLGRPLHTGGGSDSPRPASQRAAALVLTAAMLTTLTAPAFAETWDIEKGDITVKAGDTEGTNKVSQGTIIDKEDTNTVITGKSDKNTVTIKAENENDKVEVKLEDVNIKTTGGKAAVSVTGKGDTTIELNGDNELSGSGAHAALEHNQTVDGEGNVTSGELTIQDKDKNGSLTATGGIQNGAGIGAGGYGVSSGKIEITGGDITAIGGKSAAGIGGSGYRGDADITISGGTIRATGGDQAAGIGGGGLYGSGNITITDDAVIEESIGGSSGAGAGNSTGGAGIGGGAGGHGTIDISGNAQVKNALGKDGGAGIGSGHDGDGNVTISGNATIENAEGGKFAAGIGGGKVGGYGICSFARVAISGGTVNAAGGNGKNSNGGSDGIISNDIDLSGSLELTAKAGRPNGKAISWAGHELDLDTIKDKLGPGAKVTATDANGETKQVSSPIPRPVEPEEPEPVIPEESSSSSDGGSATPSAPASPLPGLTVTDKDGQRISYTSTQSGNTLTVCVGRLTASLRASLATLRQLRAEGIDTITFQTILCSTTLSVDELLAMGGEDAEAVLTHRLTASSLTVG